MAVRAVGIVLSFCLAAFGGCLEAPKPTAVTCTMDREYDIEVKLNRGGGYGPTRSLHEFNVTLHFEREMVAAGMSDLDGCLAFHVFEQGSYEVRAERADNETCRSEGRTPFEQTSEYPVKPRTVAVGIFVTCDA